jgi:hypothetical protein
VLRPLSADRTITLEVPSSMRILELKKLISEKEPSHIPWYLQILLCKGLILFDDRLLSDYAIGPGYSIVLESKDTESLQEALATNNLSSNNNNIIIFSRKSLRCRDFVLQFAKSAKIEELKASIGAILALPLHHQILILNGSIELKDDKTLRDYNILTNSNLEFVRDGVCEGKVDTNIAEDVAVWEFQISPGEVREASTELNKLNFEVEFSQYLSRLDLLNQQIDFEEASKKATAREIREENKRKQLNEEARLAATSIISRVRAEIDSFKNQLADLRMLERLAFAKLRSKMLAKGFSSSGFEEWSPDVIAAGELFIQSLFPDSELDSMQKALSLYHETYPSDNN